MPQPQPAALTFDTVKRIALGLPEVTESTSYGTAALKVRDKLMIRLKEDSETIVLRTSWEERERLMVVYGPGTSERCCAEHPRAGYQGRLDINRAEVRTQEARATMDLATPNPSIERTAAGKPSSAAHVKR